MPMHAQPSSNSFDRHSQKLSLTAAHHLQFQDLQPIIPPPMTIPLLQSDSLHLPVTTPVLVKNYQANSSYHIATLDMQPRVTSSSPKTILNPICRPHAKLDLQAGKTIVDSSSINNSPTTETLSLNDPPISVDFLPKAKTETPTRDILDIKSDNLPSWSIAGDTNLNSSFTINT
ncbi:hypothetical protein NE237_006175 [Protea cynaroides]|uniref:Uncharacterized protein n=1 Tax=Protea cynaroides TaxID=273540 RepID=A0A9Q0KM26_9MAGN|nr:hypothetical protein NE237_006175 [Protea cynaroides]